MTHWRYDAIALDPLSAVSRSVSSSMNFEERFQQLVEELYEPLCRYLTLLSWDANDSEEMAQEAFLRLHRELLQGARIDALKAWLFRVGHNLAVDRARQAREQRSLTEEAVARHVEHYYRQTTPDPEQLFLSRERMRELDAAIESLPAVQRHCLFLRREGFRYREIAHILSMGETTVMDHIRRAIERLAKELHDGRTA